jgi:hypothetical protein
MRLRSVPAWTALTVILASTTAFAQEPPPPADPSAAPPPEAPPAATPPPPTVAPPAAPPPVAPPRPAKEPDKPRFRGAFFANGGALLAPGILTLTAIGIQGQLGAQINHQWGVYIAPQFDVVFGSGVGGIQVGGAIMADWTFRDIFSVGAGFDTSAVAAFGGTISTSGTTEVREVGGALYGGRLRFEVYPYCGRGDNGIRRKAFVIGADVRLLGGAIVKLSATAGPGTAGAGAGVGDFVFAPVGFIGYQAF